MKKKSNFLSLKEDFREEVNDLPKLFHPTRIKKIQQHVTKKFGQDPERFAGQLYRQLINKLQELTHETIESFEQVAVMLFKAFERVRKIEAKHTKQLEKLAVDLILNLPEFRYIRELVEKDELRIVVFLGPKTRFKISSAPRKALQANTKETENETEILKSLPELISSETEQKEKRRLANTIAQGNALNAQRAYHFIAPQLKAIDPDLVKLYDIIVLSSHLQYFGIPNFKISMAQNSLQAGETEVNDNNADMVYTIYARAICFPILIQEIVKGIYEYLNLALEIPTHEENPLDQEINDIIVGPKFVSYFRSLIPDKYVELIPFITQCLLKYWTNEDIRKFLTNKFKAQEIVQEILNEFENEK